MSPIINALFAIAFAGEPTPAVVPWDSVFVRDTLVINIDEERKDTVVTEGYWCVFVLKVQYDAQVLGIVNAPAAQQIQRDLQVIKATLTAKAKAAD